MRNLTYAGKRVTVMGLGLFGGGAGVARYFAERGATVTVTDRRSAEDLRASLEALRDLSLHYVLGRHDLQDFRNADIVVVNPGVKEDSEFLAAALAANAVIEREINRVFKLTPCNPKLGVTGSNGKSTTAALLGEMLKLADPRALLGGNLGGSLLGRLDGLPPGAPVALELSSAMLEGLRPLAMSPHVAVVTNLKPNHLDYHGMLERYYAAKRVILDHQLPGDVAVLNGDDPELRKWGRAARGRVVWTSVERRPRGDAAFLDGESLVVRLGGERLEVARRGMLRLPGAHNLANALLAAAAALVSGVRRGLVTEALANSAPLPHRLEMVARSPENVAFYNDSIATTPESVICALDSLRPPITLIAGGSDKGVAYDELGRAIVRRVRRLVLLGATAELIEVAVRKAASRPGATPEILRAGSLEEAAYLAYRGARRGEAVVLSPASASFDMFRNFEERGERFRRLARALAQRTFRREALTATVAAG